MPLKTVVKVGNISNLNEARYCSGMGVDMLGFCVIAGRPNYIKPELYQQIRGWIPGPKIVAEIYGIASAEIISEIVRDYAPDYFEMDESEYEKYKHHFSIACLVSVSNFTASKSKNFENVAYILLSEQDLNFVQTTNQAVLLKTKADAQLLDKLRHQQIAGIALNSASAYAVTDNTFEELADILEMLDT